MKELDSILANNATEVRVYCTLAYMYVFTILYASKCRIIVRYRPSREVRCFTVTRD